MILLDLIWCLPQHICALILRMFIKVQSTYKYKHSIIIKCNLNGSVTLGKYIFLGECHWNDEFVIKHENGHTLQSYMLGWLYLLIIGIPSFTWSRIYVKYRNKINKSYYWFYTEKWANKLGGN